MRIPVIPSASLVALIVGTALAATACDDDSDERCDESCPMPVHAHGDEANAFDDDTAAHLADTEPAHVDFATAAARLLPHEKDSPVVRGRMLAERTGELLPDHVGNGLTCQSCHLAAGTKKDAAPWVGITSRFPQYRARSGKEDTLTDRVNDCFLRSMNGRALDDDSEPMRDMLAYMAFLSDGVDGTRAPQGVPRLVRTRAPDVQHGEKVYETRCTLCHGADGQGLVVDEVNIFPALWGERSFNVGAGMARQRTAAGFIHAHMPLGDKLGLSADDAWDLAGLVTQKPRPDFVMKGADWPKGGKPEDAPY